MVTCMLLMMLCMQFSMFKHGLEHIGVQSRLVSHSSVSSDRAADLTQITVNGSRHDAPFSMTCFKCLEDQAHAFALPSAVNTSLVVPAGTQAWIGLRFSLVFLSPERANQRGPPRLS